MDAKKKILFICTANRLRSRTAYELFSSREDIEVDSCGMNRFYVNDTIKWVWPEAKHFSKDLFNWADVVYVMEYYHLADITNRNKSDNWDLDLSKIINLNIEDIFEYNDPILIELLKNRVKL